jgi:hypothetical protein
MDEGEVMRPIVQEAYGSTTLARLPVADPTFSSKAEV